MTLLHSWEIFWLLGRMCYPHVRCRSVAISWVQGRGLSRPWYIGLGQPSLWPNPRRCLGHCSSTSLVFLCLPIFAKRLASPGPVSRPRSLQIPLMAPEAKWIMIVTGLCFLFWSIELSRDNQRHTHYRLVVVVSGYTRCAPGVKWHYGHCTMGHLSATLAIGASV